MGTAFLNVADGGIDRDYTKGDSFVNTFEGDKGRDSTFTSFSGSNSHNSDGSRASHAEAVTKEQAEREREEAEMQVRQKKAIEILELEQSHKEMARTIKNTCIRDIRLNNCNLTTNGVKVLLEELSDCSSEEVCGWHLRTLLLAENKVVSSLCNSALCCATTPLLWLRSILTGSERPKFTDSACFKYVCAAVSLCDDVGKNEILETDT